MDFKVTIDIANGLQIIETETRIFLQAQDAMAWVNERFAQWNNFHPQHTLVVNMDKVPSDGDTLGVGIDEDLNLAEMLS